MEEEESEADVLLSSERLSNDSPVMWPDQQHFCEPYSTGIVVLCVILSSLLAAVGDFNPLVSL
jgi:hypothetical protein